MSPRTKKAVRWLLAFAVVAAMLYVGWWYLCSSLYASIGYEVEAEFAELPPDDTALQAWLKQQPGVIPTLTYVQRTGPSKKVLQVNVVMSRNLLGEPPIPDLEKTCAELGYRGQRDRFRDTEPRSNP